MNGTQASGTYEEREVKSMVTVHPSPSSEDIHCQDNNQYSFLYSKEGLRHKKKQRLGSR